MSVSHKNLTVLNGMHTNNLDGGVVTTHPFVQNFHLKQNSTARCLYQNLSIDASFSFFPPNTHTTLQKDQTTHHRKADLKSAYVISKVFDIMYIKKVMENYASLI